MNTYAYYLGNMKIPQSKQQEFNERMLRILKQGGMMALEALNLYGYQLSLIRPPLPDREGRLYLNYSYFGDSYVENAVYDCGLSRLTTAQAGLYESNWVFCAAYLLYEFYTEDYGLAAADGEILDAACYIGWLNHLFSEKWTNARIADLWTLYEFLQLHQVSGAAGMIDRLVVQAQGVHFNVGSLYAFLYVEKDYQTFQRLLGGACSDRSSILHGIGRISEALTKIRKTSSRTDGGEIAHLLTLLSCSDPDELLHTLPAGSPYSEFLLYSAALPPQIAVKEIASVYKEDFWTLWKRVDKDVYRAFKRRSKERESEQCLPIPPVDTASFLRVSDNELCFQLSGALGQIPYTSDDDRAYYWKNDASNDVHFSEDMKRWLAAQKKRLDGIAANNQKRLATADFLPYMLKLLDSANRIYQRIFAFADMLDDYAAHPEQPYYQASMLLLEQLIEENRTAGSVLDGSRLDWELTDRRLTFNQGRLAVKRYLAVLANRELRMEVFGF